VSAIETAVLLAAGEGSRLRATEPYKPLCRVQGRALIDHALEGLRAAGIGRAIVVTGYGADRIEQHLSAAQPPVRVETVRTADYRQPNGVSALAARGLIGGEPVLLAMCDHLVDPALYERMKTAGAGKGLRLGIDRRLGHPWTDPDDVTCVQTQGTRIVAIGKGLEPHDAYDTGVFAVGPPFFAALSGLASPSITEGVRRLIAQDAAETVECSDLDWIDVDDAAALAKAEAWLAGRGRPAPSRAERSPRPAETRRAGI
jgi:1L-myo-inositol 1-phosphate cytidylyltransferase